MTHLLITWWLAYLCYYILFCAKKHYHIDLRLWNIASLGSLLLVLFQATDSLALLGFCKAQDPPLQRGICLLMLGPGLVVLLGHHELLNQQFFPYMFTITWELWKELRLGAVTDMIQWQSTYLACMRPCADPQHCKTEEVLTFDSPQSNGAHTWEKDPRSP